jgi:hypothetical protein
MANQSERKKEIAKREAQKMGLPMAIIKGLVCTGIVSVILRVS